METVSSRYLSHLQSYSRGENNNKKLKCLGGMQLCKPVTGEFPIQRQVTRSFDASFDLRLNKRLSKQWWGWWFETPSRPLWRHCNGNIGYCWRNRGPSLLNTDLWWQLLKKTECIFVLFYAWTPSGLEGEDYLRSPQVDVGLLQQQGCCPCTLICFVFQSHIFVMLDWKVILKHKNGVRLNVMRCVALGMIKD